MKRMLAILLGLALVAAACSSGDDDTSVETTSGPATTETPATTAAPEPEETVPVADATTFTVRIENVSGDLTNFDSGAFAVPAGATEPGPVLPGDAYEFEVVAAPGQRLSLATMFVQSNDGFFAPAPQGSNSSMPTAIP